MFEQEYYCPRCGNIKKSYVSLSGLPCQKCKKIRERQKIIDGLSKKELKYLLKNIK